MGGGGSEKSPKSVTYYLNGSLDVLPTSLLDTNSMKNIELFKFGRKRNFRQ